MARLIRKISQEIILTAGCSIIPIQGNYVPSSINSTSTQALAANTLRLLPIRLSTPVSFDRIGAAVTSAGDAGSVVRLGIYATNNIGLPNKLVLDAGTIDGASATNQEITINTTLTEGIYWVGAVTQLVTTTAPTVRITSAYNADIGNSSLANSLANTYACITVNSITGALPTTITSLDTATSFATKVVLRVA